jgi:hypothetical protein
MMSHAICSRFTWTLSDCHVRLSPSRPADQSDKPSGRLDLVGPSNNDPPSSRDYRSSPIDLETSKPRSASSSSIPSESAVETLKMQEDSLLCFEVVALADILTVRLSLVLPSLLVRPRSGAVFVVVLAPFFVWVTTS